MPFLMPLFAMFLLLFGSVLCEAQTATCTNWKLFALPSPWVNTVASGINRWGTVVGLANKYGTYPMHIGYGFTRYSDGTFKTYMAPNASHTEFARRNKLGVNVGWYTTTSTHGLVLSGSNLATVDYPSATDTQVNGINYWATVVGTYMNANGTFAGFKLKNGVFKSIHYPSAVNTSVSSISDNGLIVGWYHVYQPPYFHGFTLANGVYKTLDYPNAAGGTFLTDINSSGVISGNSSGLVSGTYVQNHGFIYTNGIFKNIIVPKHGYAPANGINGNGYVTGTYGSGINSYTALCQ